MNKVLKTVGLVMAALGLVLSVVDLAITITELVADRKLLTDKAAQDD